MSRGLCGLALPGLDLVDAVNSADITQLNCHEDNEATNAIISSGKNPTRKHMNRTHGVQVRSLNGEFNKPRRKITNGLFDVIKTDQTVRSESVEL